MVARLDKYVGEIMQLLKEKGMEENTLLIFTSDNGPHKEKGGDPVFFNSNGGFKGIKRDLYEGGIRVPFIIYQKQMIRSDAIVTTPFVLYDLYPTFLELAGTAVPKNIDGISMLPILSNKKQKQHAWFYWELHEAGGKQAVRMGDWKAVKLNVSKNANSLIELYDLKNDPQEKNNVASKYPEIIRQMEKIIKEAHTSNKDWPLFGSEQGNK
jgi:arylsulfatase A-like enzyme